ncbi:quercetin 2,3-dioxygenase [Allosediminivita pacifica]|uniref:Quercetin 2,3-dioxygenase n=1 Tax=Allosediminivita pacifica TaxID=1267769 RepID=A0A2T6AUN6_9RHOB|nr:quercetin 2,3-dioxygenase [Allosediminivita pacifica]PTX47446.1 quercetin 2,3-dioxygenase [Allosediminivita pacifica]GGB14288.1 quercetin 2,3-dioxygenase [Allosediminivita pacifica]
MGLSRRDFFGRVAVGGVAAAVAADTVMAATPLGQLPPLGTGGTLPGKPDLYALRNGEGEHHLVGGHVATLIARTSETGGEYTAAILTGGKGAGLPLHRHAETDEVFFLLSGRLELHMDGAVHMLTEGDYAYIPAGTPHGYRMQGWRTRVLTWSIGSGLAGFYPALGTPYSRAVQPDGADTILTEAQLQKASAASDVTFLGDLPEGQATLVTARGIPDSRQPYVLQDGEGERLLAADQLFSFTQTTASNDDTFFSVLTEGPTGAPVPWHYHQHHTENFFCLEGIMTMWLNGQEVTLHPGDYCMVPPNTVHSYRMDSPYTRFFGWLVPGVFEPFFHYLGQPTEAHVFPTDPAPFSFDRVTAHMDELDLNVLIVND